ncbi:hypothetical protein C8F04DRAFT_160221 [Mycena alexandri]|uniref:Uncharacterized protein n=1 Tax=Mycena alexandri TaxID=1745969 RepID=A0AAD6WTH7_9AGAR|nr:hypothetical protein C8F04DRAFT_160221 [Mycena alexandri]
MGPRGELGHIILPPRVSHHPTGMWASFGYWSIGARRIAFWFCCVLRSPLARRVRPLSTFDVRTHARTAPHAYRHLIPFLDLCRHRLSTPIRHSRSQVPTPSRPPSSQSIDANKASNLHFDHPHKRHLPRPSSRLLRCWTLCWLSNCFRLCVLLSYCLRLYSRLNNYRIILPGQLVGVCVRQ